MAGLVCTVRSFVRHGYSSANDRCRAWRPDIFREIIKSSVRSQKSPREQLVSPNGFRIRRREFYGLTEDLMVVRAPLYSVLFRLWPDVPTGEEIHAQNTTVVKLYNNLGSAAFGGYL